MFWIMRIIAVVFFLCVITVPIEAQITSDADLKKELLRWNVEAGRPFTEQEIIEFHQFITKSGKEAREVPSIEVGFYDSPGSATDKNIPLGDRIPLILVHGSGSDIISDGSLKRPLNDKERWIDYLETFNGDPDFYGKYKVYRFVYNSRLGIDKNGGNLVAVIDNISSYPGWESEDLDGRNFVVLAHSMGGLVTRAAMQKRFKLGVDAGERFGQKVVNSVTLGTPHHGSALAVPAWMYDSVLRNPGFTHYEFYISYVLHWGFSPYEGQFDLAWDNHDLAVPLLNIATNPVLYATQCVLVGGTLFQHLESLLIPYAACLNFTDNMTNKLVLYSGINPPQGDINDIYELILYFTLGTLNEHHLLGYTHNKMAQVIAGNYGEGNLKPYGENDGLVPLVSSDFKNKNVSYRHIFDKCDHLNLLDRQTFIDTVQDKLIEIALLHDLSPVASH